MLCWDQAVASTNVPFSGPDCLLMQRKSTAHILLGLGTVAQLCCRCSNSASLLPWPRLLCCLLVSPDPSPPIHLAPLSILFPATDPTTSPTLLLLLSKQSQQAFLPCLAVQPSYSSSPRSPATFLCHVSQSPLFLPYKDPLLC